MTVKEDVDMTAGECVDEKITRDPLGSVTAESLVDEYPGLVTKYGDRSYAIKNAQAALGSRTRSGRLERVGRGLYRPTQQARDMAIVKQIEEDKAPVLHPAMVPIEAETGPPEPNTVAVLDPLDAKLASIRHIVDGYKIEEAQFNVDLTGAGGAELRIKWTA